MRKILFFTIIVFPITTTALADDYGDAQANMERQLSDMHERQMEDEESASLQRSFDEMHMKEEQQERDFETERELSDIRLRQAEDSY